MSLSCSHHAEDLVPYIRGELEPLLETRLESHLHHCGDCRSLHQEMATAFDAAASWQPELELAKLDRMVQRLTPYIEAKETQTVHARMPLLWLVGSVATAAVLTALAFVTFFANNSEPEVVSVLTADMDLETPSFEFGELPPIRQQPLAHIRMLTAVPWNGEIKTQGRRTVVSLDRGFTAVSFVGGRGRRLFLETPSASIEVVGTRFLVNIGDEGTTTVVVAQGRVRVHSQGRTTMVRTGKAIAIDVNGMPQKYTELPVSVAYLDDAYLTEHHDAAVTEHIDHQRPRKPAALGAQISDVLEQLERAEQLVTRDQSAAAVTIYESCVNDVEAVYDPYRDICRLQLARVLGFERGQKQQARVLLELLAGSSSEVGLEASLALCELDLEVDPCGTLTCLEKLAGRTSEPQLAREAKGLIDRWRLYHGTCH